MVLMATVTNFENVSHPSKTDLRQFAELFMPLFNASTEEAKREAIAALSQHPSVPSAVAFFIACQPISLAAPFLIASKCLTDETLITIARTQGAAHARAIVRREDLSPTVIDALVGLRHAEDLKRPDEQTTAAEPQMAEAVEPQVADVAIPETTTKIDAVSALEEEMRQRIKQMAHHLNRPEGDVLGLRRLSEVQEALLVRFARERNARQFAVALADSLSSSYWLSERIMLDISGAQLATTLTGLGMEFSEAAFVLQCFYPHLAAAEGDMSRAEALLDRLDIVESEERVESWRRADSYTHGRERPSRITVVPRKTGT
ncbi:DUF2336 domain-containing protein [Agrobacterium genomosp. 3 str. CIP 111-78]|uniref:DUF2336 domain-containing protein n=2 Tax=Rhizobium/Agrobacterium group TaxID=227290 RepID=A0AAE6BNV5_AGRTU|nr:DUF2336 domain-containing protein [Agrobacterium tomkonis CIP 111-78]QCM01341.1 DUF2336 domain-containing protein [Agrobacterium tumefaciens]